MFDAMDFSASILIVIALALAQFREFLEVIGPAALQMRQDDLLGLTVMSFASSSAVVAHRCEDEVWFVGKDGREFSSAATPRPFRAVQNARAAVQFVKTVRSKTMSVNSKIPKK